MGDVAAAIVGVLVAIALASALWGAYRLGYEDAAARGEAPYAQR